MTAVTKFPRNPTNNQLYVDPTGIEWRFDAIQRRWVQNELNEEFPLASATQDGLITPEIFQRLQTLQQSLEGLDVSVFKIAPSVEAYYYYFYSPDGLIDIRHRGNGEIAMDVNEQKLIAYYYRFLCIGDRGPIGDQGDKGDPGINSPPEETFLPERVDNTLSGEVYVPIPVGTYYEHPTITPISLRFFGLYTSPGSFSTSDQLQYWISVIGNPLARDEEKNVFDALKQRIVDQNIGVSTGTPIELSSIITNTLQLIPGAFVEINVNPEDSSFEFTVNGISIAESDVDISFDREIGLLRFSITGNWPDEIVFKARQRGPDGDRGDIPDNFISTKICDFPEDANVRPDGILTHLRLDCESETFYAGYSRIASQDAYQLISTDILAATTQSRPIHLGRYAAVERVAGPLKRTTILDVSVPDLEVNDPTLQNWNPQPGCQTARSYDNYEFNWVDNSDIAACATELQWYGPEGVRPGRYPYELIRPPQPPEEEDCCQDDYFIFPETGEC